MCDRKLCFVFFFFFYFDNCAAMTFFPKLILNLIKVLAILSCALLGHREKTFFITV